MPETREAGAAKVLIVEDEAVTIFLYKTFLDLSNTPHETLNHRGLPITEVIERIRQSSAKVLLLDGEYQRGTALDIIKAMGDTRSIVVATGNDDVGDDVRKTHPDIPLFIKCTPQGDAQSITNKVAELVRALVKEEA